MNINTLLLTKLSVTPWAINQGMLPIIESAIKREIDIDINTETQKAERVRDVDTLVDYDILNGKAILHLHGVVLKKSMGMEGMSGLCTTLNIEHSILAALEDDRVEEIILDLDTPGGTSDGIAEVSDLIYLARNEKPITAFINGMACSAGYWLASAASKIYAYYGSEVGSIGVYIMHVDYSQALSKEGVKVSYIKAGKYKTAGNPYEPLTEDGREMLQECVDDTYTDFINAVAKYRDKDPEFVLKEWADARCFETKKAVANGMIDGVRNFQGLINPSNLYSFLEA